MESLIWFIVTCFGDDITISTSTYHTMTPEMTIIMAIGFVIVSVVFAIQITNK